MIAFAETVARKVAAGLNADPDHVAAGIVAAVKSLRVTGYALAVGLTCDAYAQGYRTAGGFEQYFRDHWLAWVIANILAPAWRATAAYKAAAANPTVAPAGAQEQ